MYKHYNIVSQRRKHENTNPHNQPRVFTCKHAHAFPGRDETSTEYQWLTKEILRGSHRGHYMRYYPQMANVHQQIRYCICDGLKCLLLHFYLCVCACIRLIAYINHGCNGHRECRLVRALMMTKFISSVFMLSVRMPILASAHIWIFMTARTKSFQFCGCMYLWTFVYLSPHLHLPLFLIHAILRDRMAGITVDFMICTFPGRSHTRLHL